MYSTESPLSGDINFIIFILKSNREKKKFETPGRKIKKKYPPVSGLVK